MYAWRTTAPRLRSITRNTRVTWRDAVMQSMTHVHRPPHACSATEDSSNVHPDEDMGNTMLLLPPGDATRAAPIAAPLALCNCISALYVPCAYAYAVFDMPTIRRAVRECGDLQLLGCDAARRGSRQRIAAAAAALHVSPYTLLARRSRFDALMGVERAARLCGVLQLLLDKLDGCGDDDAGARQDEQGQAATTAVPASLPRCCARHVRDAAVREAFVRLLRGVCVCATLANIYAPQFVHIVDALVYTPASLHDVLVLPGSDCNARAVALADMLLCVAEEFGSEAVMLAGLTLAARHRDSCGDDRNSHSMDAGDDTDKEHSHGTRMRDDVYTARRCMRCLMRSERRKLDWQLKASPRTAVRLCYTSNSVGDDCGGSNDAIRALAAALAALSLPYAFAVSPHPQQQTQAKSSSALRVVFSRPTHESPESPVYVTLDLVAHTSPTTSREHDGVSFAYTGTFEGTQWPLELCTNADGQFVHFPLRHLDILWQQKMTLREAHLTHVH